MSAAASPNPPPSPIDWARPASTTTTATTPTPSSSSPAGSTESAPSLSPPSVPQELQFLPPAASAFPPASSSSSSPPPSWGADPSRLKQLMMASIVPTDSTSPVSVAHSNNGSTAARVVPESSPLLRQNSASRDLGVVFDHGISKSLPSGYERCLDLKSGEVFVKKADAKAPLLSQPFALFTPSKDWISGLAAASRPPDVVSSLPIDKKQDWSLKWTQGKEQDANNNSKRFISVSSNVLGEENSPSSPDRDSLSLDLDLRLTSEKRTRINNESTDGATNNRGLTSTVPRLATGRVSQSTVQQWNWLGTTTSAMPTSIQEMVRESTMATAVCSQCLMYVLLKKSNPTCPRCSNPIILDSSATQPSSKKRPGLELSPDDLSLSTESSR